MPDCVVVSRMAAALKSLYPLRYTAMVWAGDVGVLHGCSDAVDVVVRSRSVLVYLAALHVLVCGGLRLSGPISSTISAISARVGRSPRRGFGHSKVARFALGALKPLVVWSSRRAIEAIVIVGRVAQGRHTVPIWQGVATSWVLPATLVSPQRSAHAHTCMCRLLG